MPPDDAEPFLLRFPLAGEWVALRTPAAAIPSHGTNFLGQRFAYDLIRAPLGRWAPFGPAVVAHAWGRVPVTAFASWGAPVVAAAAGRVVITADGSPDRQWANAMVDVARHHLSNRVRPVRITADDWRPLAGNYVLIRGDSGVQMYAHLRQHSLAVAIGDAVQPGQLIGAVGHSGRSTMPHLHFHLMEWSGGMHANGRLCGFAPLERWDGERWHRRDGVPGLRERIRSAVQPEGGVEG